MNFDFSDDQKLLKEQVRKFLADKCPLKVVRRVLDGNEAIAGEVWKGLVELGVPRGRSGVRMADEALALARAAADGPHPLAGVGAFEGIIGGSEPAIDAVDAFLRLLAQVAPLVFVDNTFALKGGTAINLFIRDMPRLSVDLDLVFTDHRIPRADALAAIERAFGGNEERIRNLVAGIENQRSALHQAALLISNDTNPLITRLENNTKNLDGIIWLAFIVVAIFIAKSIASYGFSVLLARIGNKIVAQNQFQMFNALVDQNVANGTQFAGVLMVIAQAPSDRVTATVSELREIDGDQRPLCEVLGGVGDRHGAVGLADGLGEATRGQGPVAFQIGRAHV